jgi:hypothetical protein
MTITAAFEEADGARGNLAVAPFEVRPNAVTTVTVPTVRTDRNPGRRVVYNF